MADQPETFTIGLRNTGPISLSGSWDTPASDLLFHRIGEQRLSLYVQHFRLFGVDFWATRHDTFCRVTQHTVDPNTMSVSLQFEPLDEVRVVRSEWWRRAIYHALKVPMRWLGIVRERFQQERREP